MLKSITNTGRILHKKADPAVQLALQSSIHSIKNKVPSVLTASPAKVQCCVVKLGISQFSHLCQLTCQPLVQKEHEKLLSCKLHSTNSAPKKQMKKSGKKPHIITWYFELDTDADFGWFVCYNKQVKQHRKHSSLKIHVLCSTANFKLETRSDYCSWICPWLVFCIFSKITAPLTITARAPTDQMILPTLLLQQRKDKIQLCCALPTTHSWPIQIEGL